MFDMHKPNLRSAGLIAVSALGFLALATTSAQQARDPGTVTRAAGVAAAGVGQAEQQPVLNPRHPDTYVVQPGDTLWDIAAMFLRDPWYWPEIWQINPQIANPHLIYPGDVLSLAYLDNGRPVVVREGPAGNTVRLSPRVRAEPLEEAIPTIPLETLRAFLSRPSVLAESEIEQLPYIVAYRDAVMGAAGNDVYTRGTAGDVGTTYNILHLGDALVDPDDNDVIGYAGIYVGQGTLRRTGDPGTLRLTDTAREALVGDYLMIEPESFPANFLPRPPAGNLDGQIISVLDGLSLIGQYQVVVINRGSRHGLEPGHVLRAFRSGEEITDPVAREVRSRREKVRLPDEPAGTIMVFRTFDRMSYALVMAATAEIHVLDHVRNP